MEKSIAVSSILTGEFLKLSGLSLIKLAYNVLTAPGAICAHGNPIQHSSYNLLAKNKKDGDILHLM